MLKNQRTKVRGIWSAIFPFLSSLPDPIIHDKFNIHILAARSRQNILLIVQYSMFKKVCRASDARGFDNPFVLIFFLIPVTRLQGVFSYFLSWWAKTQLNHWTKLVVKTPLTTQDSRNSPWRAESAWGKKESEEEKYLQDYERQKWREIWYTSSYKLLTSCRQRVY